MRLFLALLLCLALATGSPIPQIRVLQPATAELAGRGSFELVTPEQVVDGELPYQERYAQFAPLIRQGLEERGDHAASEAQVRVYYWLAVND